MQEGQESLGLRHILSFASLGFAVIGALLTILSYFIFAPALGSLGAAADAQFNGMDAMLETAGRSAANLSATAGAAPSGALADLNDALLSYASSSESLAGSLEGAGNMLSIVGMSGVNKAASDLRSSASSMRSASLKMEDMKASMNTTAEGLASISVQLSDSRNQLYTLRSQVSSAVGALQAAHIILTLAILAGFACLITLSAANLFDRY